MNALIIANGIIPKYSRYEKRIKETNIILCADGGANQALARSIKPDFVIGDLDSISANIKSQFNPSQIIYRPSQYATDLEKTLHFACEKKIQKAVVIGVSGGRLDHQICNLNILEKFSDRITIIVVDDWGSGYFVRNQSTFSGKIGQQISIFAFRRATGISTKGLKYPLQESTLEWAITDGLSNEIVTTPVEISAKSGVLFVYLVD